MPTRQGGAEAKKLAICERFSFFLTTAWPRSSTPCTWNTFFAKSRPIAVVFMVVAPISVKWTLNTSTLAHRCRLGDGGDHPIEPGAGLSGCFANVGKNAT